MTTPAKPADVCLDTCVFVNFAIVGQVEVMTQIDDFVFHVPREVSDEVTIEVQKQKLEEMFESGGLKKTELREFAELKRYADYSQRFGKGESACLAIAASRGWIVATDETKDKRLKKEIGSLGIRIVNTPGLFLKAIQVGLLSIAEADQERARKESLQDGFRFVPGTCGGILFAGLGSKMKKWTQQDTTAHRLTAAWSNLVARRLT